jgi:hypothetical protein
MCKNVSLCHFEFKGEIREQFQISFREPEPTDKSIRYLHSNKTDGKFMDTLYMVWQFDNEAELFNNLYKVMDSNITYHVACLTLFTTLVKGLDFVTIANVFMKTNVTFPEHCVNLSHTGLIEITLR